MRFDGWKPRFLPITWQFWVGVLHFQNHRCLIFVGLQCCTRPAKIRGCWVQRFPVDGWHKLYPTKTVGNMLRQLIPVPQYPPINTSLLGQVPSMCRFKHSKTIVSGAQKKGGGLWILDQLVEGIRGGPEFHRRFPEGIGMISFAVPSGELLHNGKSPCSMGKTTINGPFSIAMSNYQRVSQFGLREISSIQFDIWYTGTGPSDNSAPFSSQPALQQRYDKFMNVHEDAWTCTIYGSLPNRVSYISHAWWGLIVESTSCKWQKNHPSCFSGWSLVQISTRIKVFPFCLGRRNIIWANLSE